MLGPQRNLPSPSHHPLCHLAPKTRPQTIWKRPILTYNLCVKYGEFVDLSEAATLEFIQQHTSVPVPTVYCAFKRCGQMYILMKRIKGHKLARGWCKRSEESKACILGQLRATVDEMRKIKSPYGFAVSNVDDGSLYDMRLPSLGLRYPEVTSLRFDPFEDIPAFHRWLRRPALVIDDRNHQEVNKLIRAHENTDWALPVFTHGDLSSLNILVRGEKVVGIIDWETAGWYPSYWEFATASQVNFRNEMWAEYIDRFLEPRREELTMERIRMKYSGDT